MSRVTKTGGGVGAIEWMPFFALSATNLEALNAFNAIFPKAVHEFFVSANLARHFHAAGLKAFRLRPFLAHTTSLDEHPFWRAFIVHQMPMFIHAGLIEESPARALIADIESLSKVGQFSATFVVQAAVARVA